MCNRTKCFCASYLSNCQIPSPHPSHFLDLQIIIIIMCHQVNSDLCQSFFQGFPGREIVYHSPKGSNKIEEETQCILIPCIKKFSILWYLLRYIVSYQINMQIQECVCAWGKAMLATWMSQPVLLQPALEAEGPWSTTLGLPQPHITLLLAI